MRGSVFVSLESTYEVAARRAKSLANEAGSATFVRRSGQNWAVMSLARSAPTAAEGEDDYHPESDGAEAHLLVEELSATQDDYARSDEEGWFYPDDRD